eukprot:28689_1
MAEEVNKLKEENERLKKENDALKKEIEKSTKPSPLASMPSHEFDSIMQEIDGVDHKTEEKQQTDEEQGDVYWVRIQENELSVQQTERIKQMILSGELTVEKHGLELLRSAAHYGCSDVVETCKMHWKGITNEMYDAAIEAAEKSGNYHVANELYFGKMGKEAKANSMAILEKIKRERAVNEYLCKQNDAVFLQTNLEKVMVAIKQRLPFSQDMLSLAWHFSWHYAKNADILDSPLWKIIAEQMTDIISNMQTKQRDFLWLTTWLLESVIFYQDVDGNPLFERANEIVNSKINQEATTRLNERISHLKENDNGALWSALQEYGMDDDYVVVEDNPLRIVRQDATEYPLTPEYNEHALRRLNASIGKTGVNMIDLYNETVYLGQIHMKNAILNEAFQHSVERLLSDLKKEDSNFDYVFRAGPIKKLERCLTKIDTKYIDAKFPSASNILDIARCTVIFNDIPTMLKALTDIENKITAGGGYSIQKVLRKKNLFRDYNFKNPQYCDVKLNVEVFHKEVQSTSIIAEIQVMVQFMNTFKREISHKLYQIQRKEDHFEKMTKIAKKLTEFEPNFTAILASGKVKDLCKFMIERMMNSAFLINYRFKNDSNIFHALFRFDNIGLYEYITRKAQSNPPKQQLLRDKFQERDTSDLLEESFKNKYGGGSPIYEALNSNSEEILNLLCEQFPDLIINFFDERTHLKAIHYASFKGNPKLLQFLFKNAPKNAEERDNWIMSKENDGTTVFQWAANKGMLFAMKKCWNNLSNIQTKKEMILGEQDAGRTAFFYAVVGDHLETAKWLLSLCDDDEERSKMIHQKVDKPRVTIIEWMDTRNRFPSMVKQIKAWIKIYPLK